jgi:hypothetical protein
MEGWQLGNGSNSIAVTLSSCLLMLVEQVCMDLLVIKTIITSFKKNIEWHQACQL